jgi:NADPH2:quinone reductase
MKAVAIKKFGEPGVLEVIDLPKPMVMPGHLLIAVKATSVNPLDCKIRSGQVADLAPAFPAVLQGDVAGVVVEVGPHVSGFNVGDEVFGYAGGVKGTGGALAEFMIADAKCLAHKPKNLSFAQAAALPLVTITAWMALFDKARVQPLQKLLIHGGLGGVGHIAVQLAHARGIEVFATIGKEEDFSQVQKLGASHPICYKKETVKEYVDRLTLGKGFDVIFDTVGGKNLDLSFEAAALNGCVVTTVARSTHDLSPLHAKGLSLHVIFMVINLFYNLHRERYGSILKEVCKLIDRNQLAPILAPKTFSLWEAAKAHAYLESGQASGKVILEHL